MKKLLLIAASALVAGVSFAAPLAPVNLTGSNITCMLSTNCTVVSNRFTDSFVLPNSTGEGILESLVFAGQPGSTGSNLYSYFYRIDLSGVTALNSNLQGCFTNVVTCGSNVVTTQTNSIVCRTNTTPATNRFVCVTNQVPPSETIFFCVFTNFMPATNIVRCTNTPNGQVCFTNFVPATNSLVCFTNTVPGSNNVVCGFTNVPAATNIVCATNVITTNLAGCVTNSVPCPGATPCIESFRIRFGPTFSLSVPGSNGLSTGQVFVVTGSGTGTVNLASIEQTGGVITVNFASPLCPGSSSLYFGFVSSNAPDGVTARLLLNNNTSVSAEAVGPRAGNPPINCDLTGLRNAILQLGPNQLLAPNNNAREGRRGALLNAVDAAIEQAQQGDLEDLLEALDGIINKTDDKQKWFSNAAATQLRALLVGILDCLGENNGNGNHNDDDDNGHGHGNGNGPGHGNGNNGNKPGNGPKN
jgi:hypothetical protein